MSVTSQHPSLHLRFATLSDVSKITSLVLPQVSHDGFHDYFFPHQDRHPRDFASWWRKYYRDAILRPYCVVLLVEDSKKNIRGMAAWAYAPKAMRGDVDGIPEPRGIDIAKNSWFEVIQRRIYAWIDTIAETIRPNRCIDSNALQEWRKTVSGMSKRLWSGKDRVHWYSYEYFTFNEDQEKIARPSPDNEGLASPLLHWGTQQSKLDGVSTFVLTLISLRAMYEGLGYNVVDEVKCGPTRCIAMKYDK
ncbi:hypothetical protein J3R30DRAFT_3702553 [Lentinula aciculospora]|uniref:Acyl-CoA N-acyltransferase n=1 Tax=Lentinula aciculospora TaxID=153920 RepID=A0A9W9AD75_9AGAR|nr:hypothetical protein J3R30DRAFT_3702553 [Lentinula aciculospora]